jgi:hypothetical protein
MASGTSGTWWTVFKVCFQLQVAALHRGDAAYVISDKTDDLDEDADEICEAGTYTLPVSGSALVTQHASDKSGSG